MKCTNTAIHVALAQTLQTHTEPDSSCQTLTHALLLQHDSSIMNDCRKRGDDAALELESDECVDLTQVQELQKRLDEQTQATSLSIPDKII